MTYQSRIVFINHLVHLRLSESRLIQLIVSKSTVAVDVNYHIVVELLSKVHRQLHGMDNGFGVISVHVEDGSSVGLGNFRGVRRRARELGHSSKT
jgi:hypothetical protein